MATPAAWNQTVKDVVSGVIFMALALAFGGSALTLPMGTWGRIGPGVFPLILACILALLGVVVFVGGLGKTKVDWSFTINWRAVVLVIASIIGFGMVLNPLGFVPAVAAAAGISAVATRENRPVSALLIALTSVVVCWIIFIQGLGLTVPIFGTWLR